MLTRCIPMPLLAAVLGAVPAPAQHGLTYQSYPAHYHAGRYFPAGSYAHHNGAYYLQGHGVCHGYSCPQDYHAAVVKVQKVVVQEVPFYWSVSPYAAPAADPAKDKVLDALLLSQQQAAQYQQQQNLLLLQALLLRGKDSPAPGLDPAALTVPPIPPAAPLRQPAPAKAGIEAFIDRHCIACHGANGAKGNLDLSDLTRLSAERWADCWDAICDDTMPPAKKVPAAEKTAVKAEFRTKIFARK